MNDRKIQVLIVEDSAVARELLVHILESDPAMEVETAFDGEDALRKISLRKPDVITMDIHMPGRDGFEITRRIMETNPTPIVIVTGSASHADASMAFRTLEAGALAIIERPRALVADGGEAARNLLQKVRLMSEVKVVKRWARLPPEQAITLPPERSNAPIKVVAIGASTGGPVVIHSILERLPPTFPVPIVIVQHISAGFADGMADWLSRGGGLAVRIASDCERVLPGRVYIAPDGYQMGFGEPGILRLSRGECSSGLCPSIAWLFRSVAEVYGTEAAGVLLTGMGKDGANELRLMKEKGAVTIAQDKESSVIFGMPGEAVRIGAATYILPPAAIAETLLRLVNRQTRPKKS